MELTPAPSFLYYYCRDWDIRGPVARIWAGEREAGPLVRGKDAGSREAIKMVLWHARQYDTQHGKKTTP